MHISTVSKPVQPDANKQSGKRSVQGMCPGDGGGYVYNSFNVDNTFVL